MKKRNHKGFTLIELIVVITVIGVLAAILIPMLSGYIKKSYKKADISAGNSIGKAAFSVVSDDEDASESFYKCDTTSFPVTVTNSAGTDSYDLVLVRKTNANCTSWVADDADGQDFCDAMNNTDYIDKLGKVKYKGPKNANIWLIGYRQNDISTIEVWTADINGGGGCKPAYRVWPSPDGEYS